MKAAPLLPSERIVVIDVLRGFALLGILFVNIEMFAHPIERIVLPIDPATGPVDRLADWLVRCFGEGKFYSLFSLLFGLGFGLQLLRAEERGSGIVGVHTRRLLVLLLIGLIHAVLIWMGDILTVYALFGFLLLLFRTVKPRTLLIWAAVCLALPVALNTLGTVGVSLGRLAGPEVSAQMDRAFAEQDSTTRADLASAYEIYAGGSYGAILERRVHDLGFSSIGYLVLGPNIFAMFLVGLYFARRRFFADIEGNAGFFAKLFRWACPVGIFCNVLYATLVQPLSRMQPNPPLLAAMIAYAVGAPALCLAYVSGITLLFRRETWRKFLRPLAAAGRFPLSNYLLQSVICTMIFYSYGFGLFGQIGKAAGVGLAAVIYALLLGLSVWWSARFQFGPAEWLWRALTYMAAPPMRIGSSRRE